jgi:hypothetical protein
VDGGTVLVLKPVEVQLLTEQELRNKTGQRTGATAPAPQAAHFTRLVTDLLATAPAGPYAQLRNDFRLIEFGKLVHMRGLPATSLRYLLAEHALSAVPVPRFVGGVRRAEQGEVVCDSTITEQPGPKGTLVQAQSRVRRYQHTARGGVEVKITFAPAQFVEERAGVLEPLRRQVRAARPASRTLVWRLVGSP